MRLNTDYRHAGNDGAAMKPIGALLAPGSPPLSEAHFRELGRIISAAALPAEGEKSPCFGSEKLNQPLVGRVRKVLAADSRFAHYKGEACFRVIPDEESRGVDFGHTRQGYSLRCKGRRVYAVFTPDSCAVTEAFLGELCVEEMVELAIHEETVRLGNRCFNLLTLSGDEVRHLLDELVRLNEVHPGFGITPGQRCAMVAELARPVGASPASVEEWSATTLANVNLDAAVTRLDIAPKYSQIVRINALSIIGKLRGRWAAGLGDAKMSLLDDRLTRLRAREGHPPPVRVLLINFGSPWHHGLWNSLSIETLAGHLEGEFGEEVVVEVHRAASHTAVAELCSRLKAKSCDLLGLSVELGTLELLDEFLRGVADLTTGSGRKPLLVLGNHVPSFFPDQFLIKRELEAVVCRGEGEVALTGLIEHLQGRRGLEEIPNLVFKDAAGVIRHTTVRTSDPADLPHPPTVATCRPGLTNMLQASRGCIFHCSYCTQWRLGWRPFNLARVFQNVERLVAHGVTELEFCDDEFFGGRSERYLARVRDFAAGLVCIAAKYAVRLSLRLFTTPLIVARDAPEGSAAAEQNRMVKQVLEELKRAGLERVYIGLESGSATQKRRYARGESLSDTALALATLRQLGLAVDVGFIMFDPHLTLDELLENIRYFRDHELVHHNTWPFRPLVVNAATVIQTTLREQGLLTGKTDPEFLACEYTFVVSAVGEIARAVQRVASGPGAVFYALKTVSKSHWSSNGSEQTALAQKLVEQNALLYLDLMERLAETARHGDGVGSPSWEEALAQHAVSLQALLEMVQQRLDDGFFDRAEDQEALRRAFDRYYLANADDQGRAG